MSAPDVDLLALFNSITEEDVAKAAEAYKVARDERARLERDHRCRRCCGVGRLPQYHYIQNGRCFDCGGDGIDRGGNADVRGYAADE